MWIRTGDPVRDADDFLYDQSLRYRRWLEGRPECVICGRPIEEDRCVVIDAYRPTQTTICRSCKVDALEKAGKTLNPYIVEILQDALDEMMAETPVDVDWEGLA